MAVGGNVRSATSGPTVTTTPASSITTTSATSGGNVTADGGAGVSARGIAYGTGVNPGIAGTVTSDGTGTGIFASSLSGLAVNTQYFYRAYATNSAGTAYGAESSFYTLANIPAAPTVAGPTATSLNVSVNANGNPAGTQYAFRETTTNLFVQADGSLGAAPEWQTAVAWGTKTVSGLTPSTTYTFETASRNGADVETVYSAAASGTTGVNQLLDYWNLQYPSAASIPEGSTFEGYAQAYKGGLTEAAGPAGGISAWIGYNTVNNDPRSSGWSWIPATFNVQAGNNDEFKASLGAGLTPGTYYYASRFRLGSGTYQYGGYQGDWNNNSGVLSVTSNVAGYANIQSPYSGTITQGGDFNVYAQVYKGGITDSGTVDSSKITSWIGISPTNATTESDFSTWTWIPATFNLKNGNNFEYFANIAGASRPAGTYYYVSRFQVTGSTEYRYGGTNNNFWSGAANSGVLTVQTPPKISMRQGVTNIPAAGTYNFGDQVFGTGSSAVTFTVENTGQANLTLGTLSVSGANASEFTLTQTASANVAGSGTTTFTVTFSPTATGAKTATVTIPNNTGTPYNFNVTGTGTLNDAPNNALNLNTGACIANNQITLNWSAASGGATGYIVYALSGTAAPAMAANLAGNASSYTASSDFGTATVYGSLGKAVYKGNATAATVTGLTSGQQYTFKVVAYNGETATGWANGIASTNAQSWWKTYTIKVPEVGNPAATTAPTSSVVSWSVVPDSAGCYEYLVVASQGSVVFTPSGDGSAYAANTVYSGLNQVIYKGNGNTVTLTGLTERVQYCYKILVREVNSSQWSEGTEVCRMTGLNYCASASTNSSDNGITAVEFNAISNSSTATPSYTDFTGLSTVVSVGENYELAVKVKTYGSSTSYIKAWIDWNRSGSFDAGEDFDLGTAVNTADGYTTNSPLMIRIPSNAATGNTRLRIITKQDSAPTACTAYAYGETEDYTLVVTKPADAEINVKGGNITIPSGSTTVSGLNNTLFALTEVGASTAEKTFTIENVGQATLNLTGAPAVQLLGDHPADFTLTQQPSDNTVGVNGSVTFSIQFNPTTSDVRTAIVSISNNDPTGAENPYTFKIQGTGKCTTVPALTMLPASGPVGTVVTLTSSANDLTGAEVRLNGTVLTLLSAETNEIKVKIPAGAQDGNITVRLQTGCVFTQAFEVMTYENYGCEGAASGSQLPADLMIYEVYDDENGSGGFVSILNATSSAKNLSQYEIYRAGDPSLAPVPWTTGLQGTILPGELKIIRYAGDNNCTVPASTQNGAFAAGFNGDDVFELRNSDGSMTYDVVRAPVDKGYYMKRAENQLAGGTVYVPAYWVSTDLVTGQCVPAGIAPVLPAGIPPAITAHPVFSPGCQSTVLSVVAAEGAPGGNALAFQWYRLAPGDSAWALVADSGVYSGAATSALTVASLSGLEGYQFYVQVRENGVTCYRASEAVQIRDLETAWTGTAWSNGAPQPYSKVFINGDYNTETHGALDICELTVNSGNFVIGEGFPVKVQNRVINNTGENNFLIENDAQLIQVNGVENTGKITVRRNLDFTDNRKEYIYLSSPVSTQTMKTIFGGAAANIPFVMQLNENTNYFVNAGVGSYGKGKAYAVKEAVTGFNGPAEFRGVPANGDIDFGLYKTTIYRGYNLSGNPYPSNLDLDALYAASTNIESTFRFWDNKTNNIYWQQGGAYEGYSYAFYNADSGTGTPAPAGNGMTASGTAPNHILKVGQGFMIRVKPEAPVVASPGKAGILAYRNTQRITDQSGSVFYGKTAGSSVKDRYWLEYITPGNVVFSSAVVYFNRGTDAYAPDDTLVPWSSDGLYSFADKTKVVINGRSAFKDTDLLPLGIRSFTAGTYVIRLGKKEGVFAGNQRIYLKDRVRNTITDLTQGSYTFSSDEGEFTNRFEIVYKAEAMLATSDSERQEMQIYRDGKDFVVTSASGIISAVEAYDASGRLVLSVTGAGRELRFSAAGLAEGIYIVKARLKDGSVLTKKVRK